MLSGFSGGLSLSSLCPHMATSVSLGVSGSVPPRVRFCPCLCRALSPPPSSSVSDCCSALVILGLRRTLRPPASPPAHPLPDCWWGPHSLCQFPEAWECAWPPRSPVPASKELCPEAQTLAPPKCQQWEQEGGWRPLPVSDASDRRPGERAPSALVSTPPCAQGLEWGGLSCPPTQLCLLPACSSLCTGGLTLLPITSQVISVRKLSLMGMTPKTQVGQRRKGTPKSHRGRCGVCAYPHLLPRARLSPGCFIFYDCKHSALFC